MEIENNKNTQENREDGRKSSDLRDIKITPLNQNGATSSIYYESGDRTKIICSVFGPMTLHVKSKNSLDCEVKVFVNFLDKGKEKRPDELTEIKKIQSDLKTTIQNLIIAKEYPKSSIEINFEILENDSMLYSNLINAVSYALFTAGLLVFDTFNSCTVALMPNETTVIDPTVKEIEGAQNLLCIVYMANSKKIPYIISKGKVTNEQLEKSLSLNIAGCNQITRHYETLLSKTQ